jgi:hypothetical protein
VRKLGRLLIALALVAVAGCGGDDSYYPESNSAPPTGTYANLQFFNASWDAPPMNVLIDGTPWVRDLDYGEGTGEQSIAPGPHTIVVQIETPGAPTTIIGPTTLDAEANMDYLVAMEGNVGSIRQPGVTAVILPHQLAVVSAQSVRIQVLNPLNDRPVQIDLTAPGADLSSSTPLGTAAYQGSVGPTEVSAGAWELPMTQSYGASPSDVVQVYDSGPITLEGGMDLVISLLANPMPAYCPPHLNCPVLGPIVSAVDALGNNWQPVQNANSARVLRVVHDSPDAPALAVTINGNLTTPLLTSIAFEGATPYDLGVMSGVGLLAITPANNLSNVLASRAIAAGPYSAHTLYALGPLAQLSALVTVDDHRRYATQARLRFIQGSASANPVDLYLTAAGAGITNAAPTYAAVPFAADTGLVSYTQGIYDLTVTAAGSKTPIIGPISTWLDNGEISTVIMRDAPGGGSPYGLIELDDGLLPASLAE